tara:strand:- start:2090 stop:2362 length:273 start_codon:yes stop_codon:yes gene_type:complete
MCTSSVLKPIQKIGRGLLGIDKPEAPPESEEAKEARRLKKEMIAEQEEKQKQERQKRLQDQIRRQKRGGSGKRSLITGQGGGIGYFDETV